MQLSVCCTSLSSVPFSLQFGLEGNMWNGRALLGEGEPPTSDLFIYGGQIDDKIVHETIFDQVRCTPYHAFLLRTALFTS